MHEEMNLESLCNDIRTELKAIGLGKYSLRNYYYEGMWPIIKAYRTAGREMYDPVFTKQIVCGIQEQYRQGAVGTHIKMRVRKTADLMEEYCRTGKIIWRRMLPPTTSPVSPYYEAILTGFQSSEDEKNIRGKRTVQELSGIIRKFFRYLEKNGHKTLKTLTLQDVSNYLIVASEDHRGSMDSVLRSLRYLNKFLMEAEIDCMDFNPALTSRPSQRKKLLPAFTKQEVAAISDSINSASPMAKRDAAIFILAQNTGLRAIDIANIRLSNMNWNTNEIKLVQHKTGVELILPIEPQVGNAIVDYILNERPESNSDSLFLRARVPYMTMTPTGIGDRLRLHMKESGIDYTPGDKKGFHSFRRYVASQMLNEGVPADTVKDILGHTRIDSLKPYARISQKRLRSCALGLNGIEVTQEVLL